MIRARPALQIVPPLPAREEPELVVLEPASVYRRYAGYVAAVAQRLLGRDGDVDDTVQEVFLIAVRGLSAVRDPGAVKGWLARVTVRVARRRLRARRLRKFLGLEAIGPGDPPVSEFASPEQRTLLLSLYRALDELPADQRIAWTLRHVEGEQLDAVAALCGCSLATAKRRIAAAGQWLQEVVDDG
jgi:RNA polymerase sigma-70 factor, ECF subfamily